MFRKLWLDEGGGLLTAEFILVVTICLCSVGAGWTSLYAKVSAELGDIGAAVGSLNQSFSSSGVAVISHSGTHLGFDLWRWSGSTFLDQSDFCDCDPDCACGIVICIPGAPEPKKP
jgi:hypothetical protein